MERSGLQATGCERFFADHDVSVESGSALGEFDVVCFSIPFEGDYQAAASMLSRAAINPLAAARSADDPLVVIGGVAPSLNPEPLAEIADLIYVGEAECSFTLLHELIEKHGRTSRAEILEELAATDAAGWYVPGSCQVEYERLTPKSAKRFGSV